MRTDTAPKWIAGAFALAVAATGCSGGGGGDAAPAGQDAAAPGRAYDCFGTTAPAAAPTGAT
ncbi:MAG: hypothetical protein HOV68_06205, partial [Streptomycetaceae bacterium]|nr:hypothetical protein [Streptomycetaceae bacterium]